MLHTETVEPDTLSLIRLLQSKSYASPFLLVGGTALALQIGHRTSIDIDFFSNKRFDVETLLVQLQEDFSIRIRNRMYHAVFLEIQNVRTDFVFQPSELIDAPLKLDDLAMASPLEIAAMKIGAITARGRKRDFVDLYCLLQHYSLPTILEAFLRKYPEATMELAVRSLFYFEDADQDPEPRCFFDYDWSRVKGVIKREAAKL